jgi:hypothetical protein
MASHERLLVSTYLSHTAINICLSDIKDNMHIALQNKNGTSCLTVTKNKRQLTMPYGGRNCKQHSMQAGILKNYNE